MRISFKVKVFFFFAVISISLVAIGSLLYHKARNDIAISDSIAHSERITQESEMVFSVLKDYESGSRGYVITGDSSYLEHYFHSQSKVNTHLEELQRLLTDNPNQKVKVDSLKPLVISRINSAEKAIDLKKNIGESAAQKFIISGEGAKYMQRIRDLISRIQQAENTSLKALHLAKDRSSAEFEEAFYLLLGIVFLFLASVFLTIRNYFNYRKRKEQELFIKNEWYNQTLISLGDGVIATDDTGKVSFLNRAAVELTGWKPEEAIGKHIEEVFPITSERTGLKVINPLIQALQENRISWLTNHTILRRKDSGELFIDDSGAPIHDIDGKIIGGVLIFRDITDKKKAEDEIIRMNKELEKRVEERTKEVIEKEERYRHALDNMLEGIQIIDFNWRYIYLNDAALKHGKYNKEELIGHTMMEKYPGIEKSELFRILQRCLKDRMAHSLENEFVYPDNTVGWFQLSIEPVPEGLFILSIDISEKKLAELEKQEYLKSLEEMLFIISHKIRQPVAQILGFSHLLNQPVKSQDELNQICEYLKVATESLDGFTREFNVLINDLKQKI